MKMKSVKTVVFSGVLLGSLSARGVEMPEFRPALHINGVLGWSTADHPEEFAPGGHDPDRDGSVQLQSFEPSLSMRWGNHVEGFATGNVFTDRDDDFEWEWEEIFLKAHNLPGGMELRGGRFLNRVGFQNPVHLHSWETVDSPLPHALFLGEDGLQTIGGELNFHLATEWPTVLTLSFGSAPEHDDHGHGHDDHEGHEALEEFQLEEDFFTLGLRTRWRRNDFHTWSLALAGGAGENEEGEDSRFGLAGVEYLWRENGLMPGGRDFMWRMEAIRFRGDGHENEHGDEEEHGLLDLVENGHDADEHGEDASGWGFSTLVATRVHDRVRPFGRVDYVSSLSDLHLDSWTRYTVGTTFDLGAKPAELAERPRVYARLQGNFDERGDESEQALWVQLGFSWGGPEVR